MEIDDSLKKQSKYTTLKRTKKEEMKKGEAEMLKHKA